MRHRKLMPISEGIADLLLKIASAENVLEQKLAETLLRLNLMNRKTKLYQISCTAALVQGVLHGGIASSHILENGDFGLGTFENLDGEMAILDGQIYQMCADGTVKQRSDRFDVPFAQVCRFGSFETYSLAGVRDFSDLAREASACRASNNHFYAFLIEAYFDTMHVRAVKPSQPGTSLASAAENETMFTWNGISGCLIGFWSPEFSSSFSVPGYHFHFLSADRTKGGHVLDCSFEHAKLRVQFLSELSVSFPTSGPFLEADLSADTREALRKAE